MIEKELEKEKKTPQVEIIFPLALEEVEIVDFLNSEVGDVPKKSHYGSPNKVSCDFRIKEGGRKGSGSEREAFGERKKDPSHTR